LQIYNEGANACYREKVENITKITSKDGLGKYMIINMEYGNLEAFPTVFFYRIFIIILVT
jgi:hexokinase